MGEERRGAGIEPENYYTDVKVDRALFSHSALRSTRKRASKEARSEHLHYAKSSSYDVTKDCNCTISVHMSAQTIT